jgi:hypothetical protein
MFILTLFANVITLTLLAFFIFGWDSVYILRKRKNKNDKQFPYQSLTKIIHQRIDK